MALLRHRAQPLLLLLLLVPCVGRQEDPHMVAPHPIPKGILEIKMGSDRP